MRFSHSFVAAALCSPLALAQVTFTSSNFPSLGAPAAIAAGDLDLDGDKDLATAHPALDTVAANRNLAAGAAWANAPLFGYAAGSRPVELVVDNLDTTSSRPDIAVVLQGSNRVSIHHASGAWPGFLAPQVVVVGAAPLEAVTFDVDMDNDRDIAVICQNPSSVYVLRNTAGVFAVAAIVPLNVSPHSIDTANFNLFGGPDLVVTGSAGGAFAEVLINTTVGPVTFAPNQMFPCDLRPFGVCTGDFNGDGYMDIATDNAAFSTVSVLLNNPAALAGTTVGFVRTDYPLAPGVIVGPSTEVECGDFDCDGDVDLAVTVNSSNRVALLWNSGAGVYSAPTFAAAPLGCGDLVASEFTNDGWIDLATGNVTSNDVTILDNDLTATLCPHTMIGGISDGFGAALPFGPEDTCPNPAVVAWSGLATRDFDGPMACGSGVIHAFVNLPADIKSARLTMRMRADCVTSPNDRFMLGWDGVNATMVFGQPMTFMTSSAWTMGTFGGVGLDLGALPGGTSLLQKMALDGRLDILIGDDTTVDSMILTFETCGNSNVGMNLSTSPLIWGTTVTWNVSGAPNAPPGAVAFLIGPAVGPGPTVPGGDLCLLAPSLLAIVPTTLAGSASFSLTLPWMPFPPCVTLSNQAVGWDGTATVYEHSNTWTSQFFD
ncbi:MAG: VCBS repeat-containing protein [Planctomycetes bacterium]|nr:VCBS repeat-containing protein [Planctomycetota bacterium]